VSSTNIEFYDRTGAEITVRAYDRTYKSFDLRRGGDVHPSLLYNFGIHYLGLDKSELSEYASSHREIQAVPYVVKGSPSPGFETIQATEEGLETLSKSVMLIGDTFRLVIRESHE